MLGRGRVVHRRHEEFCDVEPEVEKLVMGLMGRTSHCLPSGCVATSHAQRGQGVYVSANLASRSELIMIYMHLPICSREHHSSSQTWSTRSPSTVTH